MAKKFPNYIYKIKSGVMPTVYVDSVDKVQSVIYAYAAKYDRMVAPNVPFGIFRIFQCLDEDGSSIQYEMNSNFPICDHTFIVEQIEVK